MGEKYISEYTEETAPPSTDLLLIDQDEGDYRKVTVQNILAGSGAKNIYGAITFNGAISGVTTYAGSGNIATSGGNLGVGVASPQTLGHFDFSTDSGRIPSGIHQNTRGSSFRCKASIRQVN